MNLPDFPLPQSSDVKPRMIGVSIATAVLHFVSLNLLCARQAAACQPNAVPHGSATPATSYLRERDLKGEHTSKRIQTGYQGHFDKADREKY